MFSADYTEVVLGRSHHLQNGGVQELGLLWFAKVSARSHVQPQLQGSTTDFHNLHCDPKTHWTAVFSQSYVLQCSEVSPDHRRSVLSDVHAIPHIYSQMEEGVFQSMLTVRSCIYSGRQTVVANVEYWLTVLVATTYCLCLWIIVILYLRLRERNINISLQIGFFG